MKQLLIEHMPFKVDKLLVEQSIKENRPLRVSGIIQRAGVKNHNGRIYEQKILEREIKKYIDGPVREKRALGELDHPESSVINLNNVSHNIVEVTMKGNDVHGVVEILTTPAGNILKELFRCGVTVGISSRGMGSVEENADGVLMVQEDFDLLCFDMVSTPSTPGAYMTPMNEGVSTPTKDYTKVNNVIRDIICDNTGMCKC
jgi:hypothetical protein|tara:strand:+ start:566 stop:1171 length:606 start_codon:yes stop_codon:yes gene_type:complete